MISYEAWKAVGGYYDVLYIGGNDAYMLQDMHRKGFRALINQHTYLIHPRPLAKEKDYVSWKYDMVMAARSKPSKMPEDKRDFKPADIEL